MEILKVKDWLEKNKKKQFEVVLLGINNDIISVKRIKDSIGFHVGSNVNSIIFPGYIVKFILDMIHVIISNHETTKVTILPINDLTISGTQRKKFNLKDYKDSLKNGNPES